MLAGWPWAEHIASAIATGGWLGVLLVVLVVVAIVYLIRRL